MDVGMYGRMCVCICVGRRSLLPHGQFAHRPCGWSCMEEVQFDYLHLHTNTLTHLYTCICKLMSCNMICVEPFNCSFVGAALATVTDFMRANYVGVCITVTQLQSLLLLHNHSIIRQTIYLLSFFFELIHHAVSDNELEIGFLKVR